MPDRLSAVDASFLELESRTTAMHVGSVMLFDGAQHFSVDQLMSHLRARIAFVPRYRRRLRTVPGKIANPVWVDDEHFDLSYHVRRSAVPRPGSIDQLHELVGRIMPRPLDRRRPLWELYVVEGLEHDQLALITKTHPAMIDGVRAVDLGQVVLDESPTPTKPPKDTWRPVAEPTHVELVTSAVMDQVRAPRELLRTVRRGIQHVSVPHVAGQLIRAARVAASPAPSSPLNSRRGSDHRRFATVATGLDLLRKIRDHHDAGAWRATDATDPGYARVTITDVVLAILAGGLRHWLLARQWPVPPNAVLRTLLPVSVQLTPEDEENHIGTGIDGQMVDLPVGEANASVRLQRIAFQLADHSDSARAVRAQQLVDVGGFAPPTLHALGIRLAHTMSHRLFNLVVTNVPGPQHPLYAAGMRLRETYPVIPIVNHQALAVGITSYDGHIYFGFHGDRDLLSDIDELVACVEESIDELAAVV